MLENKYYLTLLKMFNCERNAGSNTVDNIQDENVSAKINSLQEEKNNRSNAVDIHLTRSNEGNASQNPIASTSTN